MNDEQVSIGPLVLFNSLAHERQEVVCVRTRDFRLKVQTRTKSAEQPTDQQVHAHYVYRNESLVQDGYEVSELLTILLEKYVFVN